MKEEKDFPFAESFAEQWLKKFEQKYAVMPKAKRAKIPEAKG